MVDRVTGYSWGRKLVEAASWANGGRKQNPKEQITHALKLYVIKHGDVAQW
jgi:hypothetical protein